MRFLRKIAAGFICFAFVISIAKAETAFGDIPQTHDHYVAIMYLFNHGIMQGYSDGFKPDKLVSRAEALKAILESSHLVKAQNWDSLPFTDIGDKDWETPYVVAAFKKGIIGSSADGKFNPDRTIISAEFIKMLLLANGFVQDSWVGKQLFDDVPSDAWFAPYMNYAGHAGIVNKDDKNNVYPLKELTRADVAEIIYLLTIIQNGNDKDFLLSQAQMQMNQIEIYMDAHDLEAAKRASELAVDVTQQTYKNDQTNTKILGEAKLAKAYYFMLMGFISAYQNDQGKTLEWENQAISKASEAQEVDKSLLSSSIHIKEKAEGIIKQAASLSA